jgi:poly(3-hydroxybutyrate) depolymerase
LLSLHGDADAVVAYAGGRMDGGAHPSARASLAPFLRAGHMKGPRIARRSLPFQSLRTETWSGASGRVALWTVEGGEHQLRAVYWLLPDILTFLEGE